MMAASDWPKVAEHRRRFIYANSSGKVQASIIMADRGAAAAPQEPIKVLIVEDDPFQQNVVLGLCEACGYVVTCTSSGEEAIAMAETDHPPWDLVLCDVMLKKGGLSGVDVLLILRERFGDTVSIVMVSSNDQIEVVESCEPAQPGAVQVCATSDRSTRSVAGILEGADSYMLKPVAKNQLATARSFVVRRRKRQQVRGAVCAGVCWESTLV